MAESEMMKAAHRWADEFYSHDRFHDETHWNTAVNAYAAGWKARASAEDGVLTDESRGLVRALNGTAQTLTDIDCFDEADVCSKAATHIALIAGTKERLTEAEWEAMQEAIADCCGLVINPGCLRAAVAALSRIRKEGE
jgi:hypothetical protein